MAFSFSFENITIGFLKFSEQIKKSVEKRELTQDQADYICQHLETESKVYPEYEVLLAQDVKTWNKAWDYVKSQARKQAVNGSCMVNDEVVLLWIDEYLQKEEKEPEQKVTEKKEVVKEVKEIKTAPAKRGRKPKTESTTKPVEEPVKPVESKVEEKPVTEEKPTETKAAESVKKEESSEKPKAPKIKIRFK